MQGASCICSLHTRKTTVNSRIHPGSTHVQGITGTLEVVPLREPLESEVASTLRAQGEAHSHCFPAFPNGSNVNSVYIKPKGGNPLHSDSLP